MDFWPNQYQINTNQKKAGEAKIILNEADLRTRMIISGKEGHYIIIKGAIIQEDMTIFNVYAPTKKAPKYMGQKLKEL